MARQDDASGTGADDLGRAGDPGRTDGLDRADPWTDLVEGGDTGRTGTSEDTTETAVVTARDASEDATDAGDALADGADDTAPAAGAARGGWRRLFRRNRTLWIVAGAAVLALVLGLVLGRFVVPADARQEVPEPGLVTAPVEFGELVNDVTIRADVAYADPVEVKIDTSVGGPAVVTGQVPAEGAELKPLSVALEVSGRPVIVLPGELPAYRTLRLGVSGPDVVQLKQALAAVGISAGDVGSATFDQATADAVAALYAQAGYPAPPAPEGADEAVTAAREGVRGAEDALAQARQALATAGAGPDPVQVRQADNAVASAQRTLDAARADPAQHASVPGFEDDLALAVLQREQLGAGRDASAERAMVDSASRQVDAAQQTLDKATQQVQPFLPVNEVLYLTDLPRRVDSVKVARGAVLQGAAMTVSGATVRLTGSIAPADAALLQAGTEGVFDLPDGAEHRAKVVENKPGKTAAERWSVVLEPDAFTPEQIAAVQGQNVRVRIAVGATQGEVLSVPLAALTAGPGGESRVEVVDGDPRDGDKAKTRLVVVEPGLSARGMVEVTPKEGELREKDLVVVGR